MLWRSLETPVCVLNCLSYLLWMEKGLLLFECDRSVRTVATTIYNYWFQCDIKGPKFNHYSLQLSQTKVNNSWVWTEGIKERLPTKISVLFLSETEVKSVLLGGFQHLKKVSFSSNNIYNTENENVGSKEIMAFKVIHNFKMQSLPQRVTTFCFAASIAAK